MKYRSEIDGLRSLAVVPVILFHAGFSVFGGGYVGVDIFFVISGYLITTILIDDIEHNRFSIVRFYERRARRILPALFVVLAATTVGAYFLLYPSDLEDYSHSLLWALGFASNIFFERHSDYFATEAELVPLLHTWSLAVEEQYYIVFPVFLFLAWRLGKTRVFWIIVACAALSLVSSEFGWRNDPTANFYLAPTRAWEILAGSIAAMRIQRHGVRKNEGLALLGLGAIVAAILIYDDSTPFPSVYAVLPVAGTVLIILHAQSGTIVGRILSAKLLVAVGLVSYSAYLWHQPLLAFYRRNTGVELDLAEAAVLVLITFALAGLSWRFVERPFRTRTALSRPTLIAGAGGAAALASAALVLIFTNGASFRFDFPPKPLPWEFVKCHGAERLAQYPDPLTECLGTGDGGGEGDLYLIGDSHAAQLTFALQAVAEKRGVNFHFINTAARTDYPFSFWRGDVTQDRLLDHVLEHARAGDLFLTSFHRGHLNESRSSHIKLTRDVEMSQKAAQYLENMERYLPRFAAKGMSVYLIKDGPLLSDADTTLEACMLEFTQDGQTACPVSLAQDQHTRTRQSDVFDALAGAFAHVQTVDYLPVLYTDGVFSPISAEGAYLMFDRHHLTQTASLMLTAFFEDALHP